jgi:hypothetical protein
MVSKRAASRINFVTDQSQKNVSAPKKEPHDIRVALFA